MLGLLIVVVAAMACIVLYWPALDGPLLVDDKPQLGRLLEEDGLERRGWQGFLLSETGPLRRPVSMGTFIFNALTSGSDITGWKYTNLMLHLVAGLLVFWLSACLMSGRESHIKRDAWIGGSVIAAIWLLHPLHVSTVLYTVQRMAQLSAIFVFAGLVSYSIGRMRQLRGDGGFLQLAAAFLVFLPLAAFSKENGLLLPVLAFLLEAIVFQFQGGSRIRWRLVFAFSLLLLVPVAVALAMWGLRFDAILLSGYEARDFSLAERLMTEARVLWIYIQQLLVPVQRHMGFFHDDIVVSRGLVEPVTTLPAILGLAALAIGAWRIRCRAPLVSFGIGFFLAAHLLESTALPLELMFEHRNYLPSYGLFLALVAGLLQVRLRTRTNVGISVATAFALAVLTGLRAQTWASEADLYNYAFRVHPNSERVAAIMAENLTQHGDFNLASRVLERFDTDGPAVQRLYIKCRSGKVLTSEELDEVTSRLGTPLSGQAVTGIIEIGRQGLDKGCEVPFCAYDRMVTKALGQRLPTASSRHKLLMYKAFYLWKNGAIDEGVGTLEQAWRARRNNPVPLFLATEWFISLGEHELARSYFARALEVAENSPFSYEDFIRRVGAALDRHVGGTAGPVVGVRQAPLSGVEPGTASSHETEATSDGAGRDRRWERQGASQREVPPRGTGDERGSRPAGERCGGTLSREAPGIIADRNSGQALED
jgi:hypothetical protein